jgi:uncharacterized protein YjcR
MKNDKKTRAYNAFINDEFPTQKTLAEAIPINEKTLRTWITKFGWEEDKALKQTTRKTLLQQSYNQLKALNKDIGDGYPTREQAIAMNAVTKAIEINGGASSMQTFQVFEDFLDWILANNPKDFPQFSKLSVEYKDFIKRKP